MDIFDLLDAKIKEILTHSVKEVWRILLTNDKIGLNTVATTRESRVRVSESQKKEGVHEGCCCVFLTRGQYKACC